VSNSVALYLRYLTISVKGQMQYHTSFILQSTGHLLATAVELVAIFVLFDRFQTL
jgi:ABC-2 type transport system permease protein